MRILLLMFLLSPLILLALYLLPYLLVILVAIAIKIFPILILFFILGVLIGRGGKK